MLARNRRFRAGATTGSRTDIYVKDELGEGLGVRGGLDRYVLTF